MNLTPLASEFLWLCLAAGLAQSLAPDRWLPAAVLAWQRRWSLAATGAFLLGAAALHAALGFILFEAVLVGLRLSGVTLAFESYLVFAWTILIGGFVVRGVRFHRIREVLRSGPAGRWGVFAVFSLLGPAETALPLFLKASQLEIGYLMPFLAFALGCWLSSWALARGAARAWYQPFGLPKMLRYSTRAVAMLPAFAGLAIGFSLIFGF